MADEEELQESVINLNEEEAPVAETTAEKKPPPVPGPAAASAPATPQTGLADLQRQIQAEREERARVVQQAQQIARERDQAIAFAQEAERRGVSTYELYNENQIKATQDQMEALALEGERAMQDGDFKRAQTINLKIGRLGGSLAVLERDQAVLTQQREQAEAQARQVRQQPQQPAQQPAQRAVPSDPFERAIMNRSPQTQEFLRKHRDLVRGDGTLKHVAISAHERALDDGHQVDTPGYFDYIERTLMANTAQGQSNSGNPPRNAPTTAAPVARTGGGGAAAMQNGGEFRMTPKMRRLAAEQGVSDKEWAQNYVRLLAEGRIGPVT